MYFNKSHGNYGNNVYLPKRREMCEMFSFDVDADLGGLSRAVVEWNGWMNGVIIDVLTFCHNDMMD